MPSDRRVPKARGAREQVVVFMCAHCGSTLEVATLKTKRKRTCPFCAGMMKPVSEREAARRQVLDDIEPSV